MSESKMQRAVEAVLAAAMEHAYYTDPSKRELKRLVVTPLSDGSLFLQVETGRQGDEDTMASIFCRTYGSFRIGPNGGVRAVTFQKGKTNEAVRYPLIYGFTSSLSDQQSHGDVKRRREAKKETK